MSQEHTERLRAIKTFPQLVVYLRDELGWEVSSDDFEELTFEYSAEELGLDSKSAAKVKEIRRLRPLVTNQPWGIFFVNFEPKRLPVVALRRVLRALVTKKRASANPSERPAWAMGDLLFISSYGEADHRDISFAHFVESQEKGDLPTLKVLGWDDEDTGLRLRDVHTRLREFLLWPEDAKDTKKWREQWAKAFLLEHREVIRTSKDLAVQMARLAQRIRNRALKVLEVESDKGPLRKMMEAFKEALIHDLGDDGFADMYAQTITYGLLTARVSREAGLVAENVVDMVPVTNPFLRDMLQMFLTVGGRKAKIDFDELGINEVVHALRAANMEQVLKDFGDRNPQEDPVIHFYELFLKEYDAKKRMQRGVFYTPRPVVSYIVRSVHDLLQTEFGLEDGLADTTTWGEMAARNKGLKIPEGVDPKSPFVNILDPATGTATFLVEVIDLIHKTMKAKWLKQGHMQMEIGKLWNEYVPKHLLPRVHGYELLMAPYAVAHMKIGLKLWETGYRFKSDERARIYLTNALEPASDISGQRQISDWAPALAHEAAAVNERKRRCRFTVIVGNPPYSHWSANLETRHRELVEPYKFVRGERIRERGALQFELNIQDDYVKFIRVAELAIDASRTGIVGLITNNAYLDSATFRGLRAHLLDTYDVVRILDLHGSVKAIRAPGDENVFDIQQGVAIAISSRRDGVRSGTVTYEELVGPRDMKYQALMGDSLLRSTTTIKPRPPAYLFVRRDESLAAEYEAGLSVDRMFALSSSGVKTNRDGLTIAQSQQELVERMAVFLDPALSDAAVADALGIEDKKYWNIGEARKSLTRRAWTESCTSLEYRPFDQRRIVYHDALVFSPRKPVMVHLGHQKNLALLLCRQQIVTGFYHAFITRGMFDCCLVSNRSRENTSGFPLYVTEAKGSDASLFGGRDSLKSNVTRETIQAFKQAAGLVHEDAILDYSYAVLYSPQYRHRYAKFLQRDFPRLPLPGGPDLFRDLANLGAELIALHLLESAKVNDSITEYLGGRTPEVEGVTWSKNTVWLDKAQTNGFKGVRQDVWNFHIGSYQVCEKWLKDRKGRTLSKDDITHYQKIIVALSETIRLMAEIDKTIEAHGGWPAAFQPTGGDNAR